MASRFCTRCGKPIPDQATACASCGSPVPASSPPASTAVPLQSAPPASQGPRRMCVNCHAQMRWIGHYSLRAGGYAGAVGVVSGDAGQLSETLLPFSLYYCQSCGKFDFYYPGT